ncbi:unnamed protein product, partial [Heterosigma akashiwo]
RGVHPGPQPRAVRPPGQPPANRGPQAAQRHLPREHLPQQHAEAVHVARRPVRPAGPHLGGHVAAGALLGLQARAPRPDHRADAKVQEPHAPVLAQAQVAPLEVPVQDAAAAAQRPGVQEGHGPRHLQRPVQPDVRALRGQHRRLQRGRGGPHTLAAAAALRVGRAQAPGAVQHAGEVLAAQPLQDQKGEALAGAGPKQLDHVGVIELAQDRPLVLQGVDAPLQVGAVFGFDHLDHHTDPLQVRRQDPGHAAVAKMLKIGKVFERQVVPDLDGLDGIAVGGAITSAAVRIWYRFIVYETEVGEQ